MNSNNMGADVALVKLLIKKSFTLRQLDDAWDIIVDNFHGGNGGDQDLWQKYWHLETIWKNQYDIVRPPKKSEYDI